MSETLVSDHASGARGSTQATRVLFVTSEFSGFLKAGGLGEISAFLPRMLNRQGADVRVLIPGYRAILGKHRDIEVVADLPGLNEIPKCQIGRLRGPGGLVLYVVLCAELYDRAGSPYADAEGVEFPDNDLRFARLALAASQIVIGERALRWQPDLVHVNDWPSALAPAYLNFFGNTTPSILTVHNLAYQGLFAQARCQPLGIPERAFHTDGVEFHGKLSFLKAGLFYASHVTTVSPTYAREIITPEMGCGLDGLLRTRAERSQLTGILNGIDDSYDPQSDPHLQHHFDRRDFTGKASNAADVRATLGMAPSNGPLFALVSRLVHQKGVDLVVETAGNIIRQGGQVAANGEGEPALEEAMKRLARLHPGAVGVKIGFDETLAHRIYAGSDFLLMPSRFEPCGLSQMYAQRFGSLPIATNTGGLADTIQDNVTGFLFDTVSARGLASTINRAIRAFGRRHVLTRMKDAAMKRPAGWNIAASGYQAVYRQTMAAAG